jgi:hypothetical protein
MFPEEVLADFVVVHRVEEQLLSAQRCHDTRNLEHSGLLDGILDRRNAPLLVLQSK